MQDISDSRRAAALERFERATELPLLLLAVAMVPLLVLPLVLDLSAGLRSTFTAADWFIWAVFAFEYVVRLVLTTDRWRYVRREWPNLLIIALPFLRPLRVVRSARAARALRLSRLVAFTGEIGQEAKHFLTRHKLHYALMITLGVVLAAAAMVLMVEDGHGGAIDSFGDALWWAVSTVTTVGYGDMFPVTAAGRGIAAFLMLAGITLFGVLTANLAAFMMEHGQDDTEAGPTTDDRLDEVLLRLASMEAQLAEASHCPECSARPSRVARPA